ncbi:DUF3800 domain-containing protein [Acidovorax sp. YS12]|nr:DUF3800 domain-containing protein [Acidovorax sp. YS12]
MTQIFIDESGIFKTAPTDNNPWSVVGALAIAEQNLERLKLVVEGLPAQLGLAEGAEPKGTCFRSDEQLICFVEQLKLCNLVFVPGVVFLDETQKHLFEKVAGIDRELLEEGKSIFSSKTLQNYIQSNVLLDLLNAALWGSVLHFSRTDPLSLQAFKWMIDEKDIVEKFVSSKINDFIAGYGNNFTHVIAPSQSMNIKPFYESNGAPDCSGFFPRKVFGNFGFYESKSLPGLIAVDILSNAFRRCLRGHWDDPETVATALGTLMVDQKPHLTIKPREAGLQFNSTILPIADKFKFLTGAKHAIIDRLLSGIPTR